MIVWRRLGVRHKRLGVVKGVRRRASPQRLKNNGNDDPLPWLYRCKNFFYIYLRKIKKERDVASILPPDRSRLNMVYVPRMR